MRCGHVHGLASQRKRLGVALRAVLDRPVWGSAMRMCTAMLQDATPVCHDVDEPKITQARS